jgi:pimeloyl-ACP methyl ester carboxylesterase
MRELVDPLLAAIDSFGTEPCILAGAHTGASLAIELAANALRDRVTHVVLSGLALLRPDELDAFRRIIGDPKLDRDGNYLLEQWQKRVRRWGPKATLEGLHWGAVEQLRVFSRYHWAFEAVFAHDAEGTLRKLRCPTYFVIGDQDSLVESDRRAVGLVANGKLKVLPGIHGRLPYFEPELYAREVLAFCGLG